MRKSKRKRDALAFEEGAMSGTVLFLGAGATKSEKGLLTDEILPALLAAKASLEQQDPSGRVNSLVDFLTQEFHVDPNQPDKYQYPGLPLLLSLIDTALDRREPLHGRWDLNVLAQLREAIEFGIFDALEEKLEKAPTNNHYAMFQKFFPSPGQPCVISTNYDLVADSAMMFLSQAVLPPGSFPDYHCTLANLPSTAQQPRFGTLLKLHGSLNWMFCKNCLRMELGKTDFQLFLTILNTVGEPDLK